MKSSRPLGNLLLDQTNESALDAIRRHFTVRRLSRGDVLFEPGDVLRNVCFPTSAVVSLCSTTGDGGSVGVASVGPEGVIGASIVWGFRVALCRAIVQVEGDAICLDVAAFADALQRHPDLHAAISDFTRALMLQLVQSTACSRFHTAEQRLSRWLLETADRAAGQSFSPTHEFLALMLGMRRPWVTKVIRRLRDRGCIRFRRGELVLADRACLERAACECYSSMRQQFRNGFGTSTRKPRGIMSDDHRKR